MSKLTKKDKEIIKGTLEDNSGDMTTEELWEYTEGYPEGTIEFGDKEELERHYIKVMCKEIFQLTREQALEERWLDDEIDW
jgi:hypothetical protein